MPKIIIGNVDNEAMVGDPDQMSPAQFITTATVGARLLWLAGPGDILIMPVPFSEAMLKYFSARTGIDTETLTIITPENGGENPAPLSGDVLLAPEMILRIRKAMASRREQQWSVEPYFFTGAIGALEDAIGLKEEEKQSSFLREGGAELFNSKSFFRKLMQAKGIALPDGMCCLSLNHLLQTAPRLIETTGAIILKQELQAGGDGNIVMTWDRDTSLPGASRVLHVRSIGEMKEHLRQLWPLFTSGNNNHVIVEAYHRPNAVLYAEFAIDDHGRTTCLNHGMMRMAPLWCGFEIPGDLPVPARSEFIAGAQAIAAMAAETGFRGKINIDAILVDETDVLFNEFNGRLGGCTHIDVIARHIAGPAYSANHAIVTRNKQPVPSWEVLQGVLTHNELDHTPERGQGIIVLTDSISLDGTIEYMSLGNSAEEASAIEDRFIAALTAYTGGQRPLAITARRMAT